MYAIVDIETTGGYAAANGITEICIILHDGKQVTGKFESLVNPLQPIPRYIQAMTGITDTMVSSAPCFFDIAGQVYNLLQDRVFVAHNVNFDYSFVRNHLSAAGFEWQAKKLCTVRLSRSIFPGLASYSLGNLCRSLDIQVFNRHRAGGDTAATTCLFEMLLAADKEKFIEKSLGRSSKEQILPPNVPKSDFDKLPYTAGIYFFHNAKGKVVYVGKARNIRYRVNSHFSNNSAGRQKQNFMIHVHSISYECCGTELMAQVLESAMIKKLWPAFNSSQKRWEDSYGIYSYEDQNGYTRLAIEKNKKLLKPVFRFHYLADGHAMLRKLVKEFSLCPIYCSLQTGSIPCGGIEEGHCHGACTQAEHAGEYNQRVALAIKSLRDFSTYAILDEGPDPGLRSCILVCEGEFYGLGHIPAEMQVEDADILKTLLTPYKENLFIKNLLAGYSTRYPEKVIVFAQEPASQAI